MISGVSLESIHARRTGRPDRGRRAVHCRTSTRAPSARPAGTGQTTFSPSLKPGEHFDASCARSPGGDQARARDAVFDHEHRLQLAALDHRRRRNRRAPGARPAGNRARPNMPERRLRHRRQIDLDGVGAGGRIHRRHDLRNARVERAVQRIQRRRRPSARPARTAAWIPPPTPPAGRRLRARWSAAARPARPGCPAPPTSRSPRRRTARRFARSRA